MIYPQWSGEEDTEGSAQKIQQQKTSVFFVKLTKKQASLKKYEQNSHTSIHH